MQVFFKYTNFKQKKEREYTFSLLLYLSSISEYILDKYYVTYIQNIKYKICVLGKEKHNW